MGNTGDIYASEGLVWGLEIQDIQATQGAGIQRRPKTVIALVMVARNSGSLVPLADEVRTGTELQPDFVTQPPR